ncbi:hypothetical protein [Bacillus cereus group sp. BfR-BA-01349]|uniref:hypothetical protein n=1 Tax=Bacillus cereus group sp. BfR-BA-01349 TaxID=2920312 RepID=UPI001F59C263
MKSINTNLTERFYPKEVSIFDNEPSTEKFAGKVQYHQTLYTLQLKTGVYIEDPYFMGKVLHSCEPNSIVNMETQEFYVIRDINVGDYITIDYLKTEDVLFQSFQCACGTSVCKGYIAGRIPKKYYKCAN